MQLHSRLVSQPKHNQDCKTSNTKKGKPKLDFPFFVDFGEGQFSFVVFAKNIKVSLLKSNGVFVWKSQQNFAIAVVDFSRQNCPIVFYKF
ncbi:MAG: hypothetical protein IJB95_04930 [Clostridia bacterium]|nr:hypothetical protein [Clostridia bacterium]